MFWPENKQAPEPRADGCPVFICGDRRIVHNADPVESAEEAIAKLQQAMDLLGEVVDELRAVEADEVAVE